MNKNELTELAEAIVNDGFNQFYVPKVKVWFGWDEGLSTWVVTRDEKLDIRLLEILGAKLDAARVDGTMEELQAAMDLFKPAMKARLLKAIRTFATRDPEFLLGDFPPATVTVVEVPEVANDEEASLPEIENNDHEQHDDRF